MAGFRYVRTRPDIIVVLCMIFVVGTFGVNFPIFTSTMARVEFGKGAGEFGLLNSVMAIGSVAGALLSARRDRPRMRTLVIASAGFGLACTAAALAPTYWSFAVVLVFVGLASLTFMTTANALVQTTTKPAMRGRVMALYMAIFAGGTPIGAPIVGAVADAWGPRWAIVVGAASGFVALAIALVWLVRWERFRVRYDADNRLHLAITHAIPWSGRARRAPRSGATWSATRRSRTARAPSDPRVRQDPRALVAPSGQDAPPVVRRAGGTGHSRAPSVTEVARSRCGDGAAGEGGREARGGPAPCLQAAATRPHPSRSRSERAGNAARRPPSGRNRSPRAPSVTEVARSRSDG